MGHLQSRQRSSTASSCAVSTPSLHQVRALASRLLRCLVWVERSGDDMALLCVPREGRDAVTTVSCSKDAFLSVCRKAWLRNSAASPMRKQARTRPGLPCNLLAMRRSFSPARAQGASVRLLHLQGQTNALHAKCHVPLRLPTGANLRDVNFAQLLLQGAKWQDQHVSPQAFFLMLP